MFFANNSACHCCRFAMKDNLNVIMVVAYQITGCAMAKMTAGMVQMKNTVSQPNQVHAKKKSLNVPLGVLAAFHSRGSVMAKPIATINQMKIIAAILLARLISSSVVVKTRNV